MFDIEIIEEKMSAKVAENTYPPPERQDELIIQADIAEFSLLYI